MKKLLGWALGLAALTGCSGDRNLLVPVVDTVFQHEQSFSSLPRFQAFVSDFSVPEAGTLRVTVDWKSPADDIDLVLSNPACDAVALAAGGCKVFATEESNRKPAELAFTTTATGYRLFVFNRGPADEAGTIMVVVTRNRLAL